MCLVHVPEHEALVSTLRDAEPSAAHDGGGRYPASSRKKGARTKNAFLLIRYPVTLVSFICSYREPENSVTQPWEAAFWLRRPGSEMHCSLRVDSPAKTSVRKVPASMGWLGDIATFRINWRRSTHKPFPPRIKNEAADCPCHKAGHAEFSIASFKRIPDVIPAFGSLQKIPIRNLRYEQGHEKPEKTAYNWMK